MNDFNTIEVEKNKLNNLIYGTKKLIETGNFNPEEMREIFDESWWNPLGINNKKYKLVRVTLERSQEAELKFIMPDDDNDYDDVIEYIANEFSEEIDTYNTDWIVGKRSVTLERGLELEKAQKVAISEEAFNSDTFESDFDL